MNSGYSPDELKYSNKTLYSYKIRDGDEFEVYLKREIITKLPETTTKMQQKINKNFNLDIKVLINDKIISTNVDTRQTINEFKRHLAFIIGIESTGFKLFHKKPNSGCEMKLLNKNLSSIDVKNGDLFEIVILNKSSEILEDTEIYPFPKPIANQENCEK